MVVFVLYVCMIVCDRVWLHVSSFVHVYCFTCVHACRCPYVLAYVSVCLCICVHASVCL